MFSINLQGIYIYNFLIYSLGSLKHPSIPHSPTSVLPSTFFVCRTLRIVSVEKKKKVQRTHKPTDFNYYATERRQGKAWFELC